MNRLHILFVLVVLFVGCGPTLRSLGRAGNLKPAPGFDITPERAVELAQPHLEKSYELRRQHFEPNGRSANPKPPSDHVTLKGDTYYIVRDNYPAIKTSSYLYCAVKVNANTGEVTPPSE